MEKADLKALMASTMPKHDTFLPKRQFDELYDSLTPEARSTIEVGRAVVALLFGAGDSLVRIYRGDPRTWGVIQRRMAFGDFDPCASPPLAEGTLGLVAAVELRREGGPFVESNTMGPPASPMETVRTDCTQRFRPEDNLEAIYKSRLKSKRKISKKAKKAKSKTRTRKTK